MPDWRDEARTLLAAGFGQAESARKLGVPIERLKKWAQRAGIRTLVPKLSPVPAPALKRVPNVPTAAQILADTTVDDSKETRIAYIRRARITALAALDRAEQDAEKALQESPLLLADAKLLQAANAPGFERQDRTAPAQVLVQVGLLNVPPQAVSASASTPASLNKADAETLENHGS